MSRQVAIQGPVPGTLDAAVCLFGVLQAFRSDTPRLRFEEPLAEVYRSALPFLLVLLLVVLIVTGYPASFHSSAPPAKS